MERCVFSSLTPTPSSPRCHTSHAFPYISRHFSSGCHHRTERSSTRCSAVSSAASADATRADATRDRIDVSTQGVLSLPIGGPSLLMGGLSRSKGGLSLLMGGPSLPKGGLSRSKGGLSLLMGGLSLLKGGLSLLLLRVTPSSMASLTMPSSCRHVFNAHTHTHTHTHAHTHTHTHTHTRTHALPMFVCVPPTCGTLPARLL